MNREETANLLAAMAAFDRRTIGRSDVVAWHALLEDVTYADALDAVKRWYAEETEWMMPAHVRRSVWKAVQERAKAERRWAAGQYGVPKDEAYPEIAGQVDDSNLREDVKARLRELLAERFPDASREVLHPRRTHWEREHTAYRRQQEAEPNPNYRPRISGYNAGDRVWVDEIIPATAERQRQVCRDNGPHDDGMHIDTCPDAVA